MVDIELQLRFGRARITCPTMPLSTSTTEHGLETADLQEPAAFRRSRSADPALRHYGLLGRPRTPGLLRPVCPRHPSNSLLILEWQVAPRLTIVTRCRDNMNERIHCTPSFLINLG